MENSLLIASTNSGGGKSTITLGLLRALYNRGKIVQPFKCGPDYIDPAFHTACVKRSSVNLDTWMIGESGVTESFRRAVYQCDIAVTEGVMGLFDSRRPGDLEGSSADIARLLKIPVILVVEAKGMAGTIAPIVSGFLNFHPEVKICGVIANRVGSIRHGEILAEALKAASLPPLLGAVPVIDELTLPERHLGLTPVSENPKSEEWFDLLANTIENYCDIDTILKCSSSTSEALSPLPYPKPSKRIAVARDEAFNFYYEENFHTLRKEGYEIVHFSPIHDTQMPENVDFIYLGGGFPESFAKELSENVSMITSIREYAENGGKLFAECGGYVYLCNELILENQRYSLCGIINGTATMNCKRQALGYRSATLLADSLFGSSGRELRGHEFHYTSIELHSKYNSLFRCEDSRGKKWNSGVTFKGVTASYIHLYGKSSADL